MGWRTTRGVTFGTRDYKIDMFGTQDKQECHVRRRGLARVSYGQRTKEYHSQDEGFARVWYFQGLPTRNVLFGTTEEQTC